MAPRLPRSLLLACIISGAASACSGDEPRGRTPPAPDSTPPSVLEVSPVSGSSIGVGRTIRIVFSEAMRAASLATGGSMAGDGISAAWATPTTLSLSPTTTWVVAAARNLTIDATDASGNALATLSLTYTVDASADGTPPTATVLPTSAATIAPAQPIVVTFSESMARGALVLGGTLATQSNGGAWSAILATDDRLTISATATWTTGPATLTLAGEDLAGNPLAPLSVSYTIDPSAPLVDAVPPTGIANPPSGELITPATVIQISFDEPMDTASLTVGGSLAGVATDSWNINDDVLTLAPAGAWNGGSGTLVVNADDVAGNPAATLSLSYVVDGTAPTANATPVSGTRVDGSTSITIQFSEAIETTSLVLGGTLASESDGGQWTAPATLVVSPTTTWTTAAGATLSVDAADLAGNAMTTLGLSYDVDASPPALVMVTPPNAGALARGAAVLVQFDESLALSSVTLGGTLISPLGAAYGMTLAQVVLADDQIRIQPSTLWNRGADQTLTVDVTDLIGNPALTLNLTFDVDVVFVSVSDPNATDAGTGTRAAPYLTLRTAAINHATSEIRVAAGTYNLAAGQLVSLSAQQVYGGYSMDWSQRAPATYVTQVVGSTGGNGAAFVLAGTSLVDGFTIRGGAGGGGTIAAVMLNAGTPTVRNNTIQAPWAGTGTVGVFGNLSNTALVEGNEVLASGHPSSDTAIFMQGGFNGTITTNTISTRTAGIDVVSGGSGAACNITGNTLTLPVQFVVQSGIRVTGIAGCAITTNTVELGGTAAAGTNAGIDIVGTTNASTVLSNSVLVPTAATTTYGVRSNGTGEVRGNTIEVRGSSTHYGIDLLSTGSTAGALGNRVRIPTGTNTYGIRTAGAGPIRNNVVESLGTTAGWAVSASASAAPIQNNSLGFADGAIIFAGASGGALVENNILQGTSQSGAFCVFVSVATARPIEVRNNDFYNCGSGGAYSDAGTGYAFVCPTFGGSIATACGGTTLTTPAAVSNTNDNPVLTVDYVLQASSPVSVRTGGNTISAITADIAGTPRSTPYSMGAYEVD